MKCEICGKENAKLRIKDQYYHKKCLLESRNKGASPLKIKRGEEFMNMNMMKPYPPKFH